MTDFIPRRRARSVLTSNEYKKLCNRERNILDLPPSEFDEEDESCVECHKTKTLGHWYDTRSSSGSITDSLTDDSVESGYSPLAEKHFQSAFNHGVFSEVATQNRSDRKKSYDKLYKKPRFQRSSSTKAGEEDAVIDMPRNRSVSFDSLNVSSHAKKKPKKNSKSSKREDHIRQKLSNSGISLMDKSGMSLDEIHELQQRFYSMNLKPERSLSNSDGNPFQLDLNGRDRSVSFN